MVIDQGLLHLPYHGLVVALGLVDRVPLGVVDGVPLGVGHWVPLDGP